MYLLIGVLTRLRMQSPVLFLIFNRPQTTAQVFAAIRLARPSKLYVAADGPRSGFGKEGEWAQCQLARQIATAVDWPCEVKTLFREHNLGCKLAVSSAIAWFFQAEEEGIILEDDVLPMPSFFPFCDELLARFRDDSSIGMIAGSNLISRYPQGGASYFAANVPLIWGWATWRRAWQYYDVTMQIWPEWRRNKLLNKIFHGDSIVVRYWTDALNRVWSGQLNTWDYQWLFTCWSQGMGSIIPAQNLTDNLGYGVGATHTANQKPACLVESIPKDLTFPLQHPSQLKVNWTVDRFMFEQIHGITILAHVRSFLRPIRRLWRNIFSASK